MVGESSLKGVFSKAYVGLIRPIVYRCHSRLVYHGFLETIPSQRAVSWFPTVACFCWHNLLVKGRLIMAVDVLFEVGHAAVTDFHCVTVEDLV